MVILNIEKNHTPNVKNNFLNHNLFVKIRPLKISIKNLVGLSGNLYVLK